MMITIRMIGGLGNQLFLYALYEKMLSLGKEAYIYLDKACYDLYKQQGLVEAYQLPLLGLDPVDSPASERIRKNFARNNVYDLIERRVLGRFGKIYQEKEEGKFDPDVLRKDNAFFMGYFQTEKYFEDIGESIRNKIHFEGSDDGAYSEILKEMRKDNSVSIHVRNYLDATGKFDGICDSNYYRTAIEEIRKKVSNPVFYLFSDNMDAAERMLSEHKVIPVRFNRGPRSYLDMFLMSQCRHHIIANSSFSWWGAWLNPHSDKIVIAPKRWLNDAEFPDICPESWIRIGQAEAE